MTKFQITIKEARAELYESIPVLGELDLLALLSFLHAIEANHGNAGTPIEDFIVNLPRRWERGAASGYSLTPDDLVGLINDESDGTRSYFDDAVAITQRFNTHYPHLVAAPANAILSDQDDAS